MRPDDSHIAVVLRVALGAIAVGSATAALLAGTFALGMRLQPDTGHGEDIGRPFGFAASFVVLIPAACVGLGAASGYTVLGKRWWRRAVVSATLILVAAGVLTFIFAVRPL